MREELFRLLHRSRPLYSAPDALRARVIRTTELLPSSGHYTPPRLRRRILRVLARPLQSAGGGLPRWPVLVAAILLVVAGLLPIPGILRKASANSYIEAAVAAHRSSLNGSLPLEIKSESPAQSPHGLRVKCLSTFGFPRPRRKSDMNKSID